jgi:hypothetical protein
MNLWISSGGPRVASLLLIIGALVVLGVVLIALLRVLTGRRKPDRRAAAGWMLPLGGAVAVLALLAVFGLFARTALTRGRPAVSPPYWPLAVSPAPPDWRIPDGVRRHLAEAKEHTADTRDKLVAEARRAWESVALEVEQTARLQAGAVISSDGESLVVLPPDSEGPPAIAEIPQSEASHRALEHYYSKLARRDPGIARGSPIWSVATALVLAAFLFVGYILLDASTRGQFTWSLRILSALAFVAIVWAMAALRHGL